MYAEQAAALAQPPPLRREWCHRQWTSCQRVAQPDASGRSRLIVAARVEAVREQLCGPHRTDPTAAMHRAVRVLILSVGG